MGRRPIVVSTPSPAMAITLKRFRRLSSAVPARGAMGDAASTPGKFHMAASMRGEGGVRALAALPSRRRHGCIDKRAAHMEAIAHDRLRPKVGGHAFPQGAATAPGAPSGPSSKPHWRRHHDGSRRGSMGKTHHRACQKTEKKTCQNLKENPRECSSAPPALGCCLGFAWGLPPMPKRACPPGSAS
jgi:hypothetical protein